MGTRGPDCTCTVGPGRLESEGPITLWASWMDAEGDAESFVSFGEGDGYASLLIGPFEKPGAGDVADAKTAGFCDGCIDEAARELVAAQAIVFETSSQGFLSSETFEDEDLARAAFQKIAIEAGEEVE